MGSCLSANLHRSSSVSSGSSGEPGSTHFGAVEDLKNVIRKRPELKRVAEDFPNCIVPRIKRSLSDIDRGVDLIRSNVVATIRAAVVLYQHEKENKERQAAKCQSRRRPLTKKASSSRKNLYDDTIAELRNLEFAELAADDLPALLGDLKDAMGKLRRRKQQIEKRLRSKRRWHKAWSVALNAAVVGVLVASVLLAAAGAGPVAIAGATAGATVMKAALEPLVNSILDEKERALEEEKKIVEMMRDGEYSLVHELDSVRSLADRVAVGVVPLVDCVEMAREATEEAVEVAMDELAKKIGEVETSLVELKMKVRSCCEKLQRSESKFMNVIRN